jgi:hypothetical protein
MTASTDSKAPFPMKGVSSVAGQPVAAPLDPSQHNPDPGGRGPRTPYRTRDYRAGNSSSYAGLIITGWPSLIPTEPRNRTRAPHTMPGMCERP